MIQEDCPSQSDQSVKYKIRRSGPLDAYIYKEWKDQTNVEERKQDVMVHTPTMPMEVSKDKVLHIFTDGACTNNGKRNASAAWGCLLVSDLGHVVLDRFSAAVPLSEPQTNQRAELRGILKGVELAEEKLKADPSLTRVQIWSDSQYSINCASVWGPNWKKAGWKKQGGPIQHLDLIQPLVLATQRLGMKLYYKWLKAHKMGESQYAFPWCFNHQVDSLATGALRHS